MKGFDKRKNWRQDLLWRIFFLLLEWISRSHQGLSRLWKRIWSNSLPAEKSQASRRAARAVEQASRQNQNHSSIQGPWPGLVGENSPGGVCEKKNWPKTNNYRKKNIYSRSNEISSSLLFFFFPPLIPMGRKINK